jgi:eukaryotic-like serine/threonine-protein kinase
MVTEVPGYALRDPIGTGASATVWRGEAVGAPGRVVAVEVVPLADARAAVEALRRESEILGRLSHPSILEVLAVVPTGDGLALVTPFAAGGSLASMLAHGARGLPAAVVADIGARLASALAAMHGAGIVHRDLRPANVWFDRERQPLLGVGGIARLNGDVTAIAGTAEYLDPDLSDDRGPDAHSDLYALGVTLYEALAGVPPYSGTSPAQTLAAADRGRFVPLADHVEAPPALTAAIEAAFARGIRDRPAGAHEFAGELLEIRRMMEDDGPPARSGPATGRAGVLGAVPNSARTPASSRESATTSSDAAGSSTLGWRPAVATSSRDRQPAPRRAARAALLAAAFAIVLVPSGIVLGSLLVGSDGASSDPTGTGGGASDPSGGIDPPATAAPPGETAEHTDQAEREPPPLCDGVQAPDDGREFLLADVDGAGCSSAVAWDGRRMEVLGASGTYERYDLGARPDDVLRFGDWSCDGRDAPALYRPADGRLFTFEAIAAPGTPITATGTPTGVTDGVPTVVTDDAGCDRMEFSPS